MAAQDAEARSSQIVSLGPQMQGRVDAVDNGHVLGWAWHTEQPTERLTVEAVYDGRLVAKAVADRARVDLRRNGIGDGSYAFDLQIDPALADLTQRLVVRAIAPSGEVLNLRIPSQDERAAEAAVAVPLARVLERMELLIAAQRQTQLGQRDTSGARKDLTERIDALSGEGGEIDAAVAKVAGAQTDIAERVATIEIFLSRFDSTLAGFDLRLQELKSSSRSDTRPLFVLLAAMLGFAAGAAVTFFVG
jgi:hypothetical protein